MIHRFAEFELDETVFELRRGGSVIPLQRRVFDLLHYLVRRPDVVVSKDELLRNVWPDVTVTKEVLPRAMNIVRMALGDDAEHPTLIQTVRGRGYRFVSSVVQSERAGPSGADVAVRLIGRGSVLAALRARLAGAEGGGSLALVAGAQGVGKTRLLEELARAPSGARVLALRCSLGLNAPELWPFAEALRALARSGAPLDAQVSALADGTLDPACLKRPESRFRLFDAITRAILATAAATPLLCLVDDLDHADQGSLEVVELLASRLDTARALVVATHRPAHARAAGFGAAYGSLTRMPWTKAWSLDPFTRPELAEYLAAALPSPPTAAVVDRVHDKTQGNPLLASQLVHVLSAEEHLRAETITTSGLVGDDNMREVIAHRIAALASATVRVLTVASVFGTEFPIAPLGAALAWTNAEVLVALDGATTARIVAASGRGRYRFTYPLVRDVLYKRLLASERAELHGLAARGLEEHAGEVTDHTLAGLIAHHLVEAAASGDAEQAIDWSLRAVELAERSGDGEARVAYAARGLLAVEYSRHPNAEKRARLVAASRSR